MEGGGRLHLDQQAQSRPVCITGMHRTGTSLVAGLLHRHGLWLGDESDMMPANAYNPDGYYENDRVVEVNDGILSEFGGSWKEPPALTGDWAGDPRLTELRATARDLGARLGAGRDTWGFKDPRAALTLPFWRSVWGELTVVVTVRNPLETARSLNRRDDLPLERGVALWQAHYRSILNLTSPETRIVVGYESMCANPATSARALLMRVPGLLEIDPAAAHDTVRPALWHFRETLADFERSGAPADVVDLYRQLHAEAINPEQPEDVDVTEILRGIPAALAGLDLAIRDVHVELERLAAVVARVEARGATEQKAAPDAAVEMLANGQHD
jgi:hypothetical protein